MIRLGFDVMKAKPFIEYEPRRWPHVIALIAVIFALVGCAGGDRPVATAPIRQACVDQADVPPEVPPIGELPTDARQAADALGAQVLRLRGNERILRAILGACIRP